jgi:ABC-type sulfate transport system substrate-binding protein
VPDNQTTEANRGKDGSDVIATEWHSKVVELASPFEEVHFKRLIVDYEWAIDDSAGDTLSTFNPDTVVTTRPKVELRDGEGVLVHTFYLPAGGDPSVTPGDEETYRQRFVYDFFSDVAVSEIQVRIEYTGAATALVKNAIHDVWLEFTRAHERRNA